MKQLSHTDFRRRIFNIFVLSGGISNVIGSVANAILFGFSVPTVCCIICTFLIFLGYFIEKKTRYTQACVLTLLAILCLTEFPVLVYEYGRSCLPYMLIGVVCLAIFVPGRAKFPVCFGTLLMDAGFIVYASFYSTSLDRAAEKDMLGATVCTFLIAGVNLTFTINLLVGNYEKRHLERDVLTGELNRSGFVQNVQQRLTQKSKTTEYAILFLNLKGFKVINELFSQSGGDELLRSIPGRLAKSFLQPEVIARLEGDHFVCLIRKECLNLAKLGRFARMKYEFSGKQFSVLLRCGIYEITDPSADVGLMCDRAKLAEKYIQDEYNQPYAVFREEMAADYVSNAELIEGAKAALKNSEFRVFYQPVYDAVTEKPVSAEALVRWKHPEHGMISPGRFVPVLEETGMISKVDLYVEHHVKKLLEYRYNRNLPILPVSVNLSRMDFYDGSMLQELERSIKESPLPKQYQRYEITESACAAITDSENRTLLELRKMEIPILLDDFGSGYSSFSTIDEFRFDIIKIDMGFVQKLEQSETTRSIVSAIISMAHSIGARVVAEGVETEGQLCILRQQGCDYIQGYYFSKPLSQKDFCALLDENNEKETEKE